MSALSSCFRCGQSYAECTRAGTCRGYKGMPEPWIVQPSGGGFGVIHAATNTEAAWAADRGEAQKIANDFIIEERTIE